LLRSDTIDMGQTSEIKTSHSWRSHLKNVPTNFSLLLPLLSTTEKNVSENATLI